jgi:hypothetical protein
MHGQSVICVQVGTAGQWKNPDETEILQQNLCTDFKRPVDWFAHNSRSPLNLAARRVVWVIMGCLPWQSS